MARSSMLNKESLVKLGAERLAELLLDEAERNGPFKKLVLAALAAARGPDAIAAGLERASGAIGWERVKSFSDDLAAVLKIITGDLAKADAEMAADRLLRFLATADRTLSRTDGSDGEAAHVYHAAAAALPALVGKLSQAQNASLADRLYALAAGSRYRVVLELMPEIIGQSPGSVVDALASAVSSLGPIDESDRDWNKRMRVRHLIELRQHIADSRGDVDAFIAPETSLPELRPDAADIAERLARAGRHREALDWLRRPTGSTIRMLRVEDIEAGLPPRDPAAERRARLEIDVLEAMGERSEARALRRKSFETTLDAEILRDHLAHLPDFEDVDALDAAFAHALASPLSYAALRFLVARPRLDLAGSSCGRASGAMGRPPLRNPGAGRRGAGLRAPARGDHPLSRADRLDFGPRAIPRLSARRPLLFQIGLARGARRPELADRASANLPRRAQEPSWAQTRVLGPRGSDGTPGQGAGR